MPADGCGIIRLVKDGDVIPDLERRLLPKREDSRAVNTGRIGKVDQCRITDRRCDGSPVILDPFSLASSLPDILNQCFRLDGRPKKRGFLKIEYRGPKRAEAAEKGDHEDHDYADNP